MYSLPFLEEEIQAVAGSHISLINPAPAVARHLYSVLDEKGMLSKSAVAGTEEFYVTGANPEREAAFYASLWHKEVLLKELPSSSTR